MGLQIYGDFFVFQRVSEKFTRKIRNPTKHDHKKDRVSHLMKAARRKRRMKKRRQSHGTDTAEKYEPAGHQKKQQVIF